jgi:hypothetical protein
MDKVDNDKSNIYVSPTKQNALQRIVAPLSGRGSRKWRLLLLVVFVAIVAGGVALYKTQHQPVPPPTPTVPHDSHGGTFSPEDSKNLDAPAQNIQDIQDNGPQR